MATETQRATARSLRVDTVTGEVIGALRDAGVPSLVIKGPVTARLLYDDGASRPYSDSDVLVPRSRLGDAEAVLGRLGFEPIVSSEDVPSGVSLHHGSPWRRRADFVDLHWTLPGCAADPDDVWRALASETRTARIGGADATVPNGAFTALVSALHMTLHGAGVAKPREDLERALRRLPRSDWERASQLAERVEVLQSFAAGLRMCEPGERLAAELELPRSTTVALAISAAGAPGTAHGIEVLAQTPGLRGRARLVARTLVPPRRYMALWFPRATRSRVWLGAAYLYRPLWLAGRAGPSIAAWLRARRAARSLATRDGP